MKNVYVAMAVDVLHPGHLNIIKVAKKYGKVIIGLLTDEAIAQYKRKPILNYQQRKIILESIIGIDEIVIQESYDYTFNLKKIRPDYVVHGDDWKVGVLKESREKVIKTLQEWGGCLIEPKYTEGVSSTKLINKLEEQGITPNNRLKSLNKLLLVKPFIRCIEAHNGLTGLIAQNTYIQNEGRKKEFDAIWLSSLTVSTSMGKPDTELVDFSTRFKVIEEIVEVTTKPIIVDGDTGGKNEHFVYTVRTLERLGVSAIIIEDKIGVKRNSLFGTEVNQEQDNIQNFCEKIKLGNHALMTDDFIIIARIESFILNKGITDALDRAKSYIEAGARGIMIHSKEKDGKEIIEFSKKYTLFKNKVPLVVVPSTFNHMTEGEFEDLGISIVIYGNHLIRSAYPAMVRTAESILQNGRCKEASDQNCMTISKILRLIPEKY